MTKVDIRDLIYTSYQLMAVMHHFVVCQPPIKAKRRRRTGSDIDLVTVVTEVNNDNIRSDLTGSDIRCEDVWQVMLKIKTGTADQSLRWDPDAAVFSYKNCDLCSCTSPLSHRRELYSTAAPAGVVRSRLRLLPCLSTGSTCGCCQGPGPGLWLDRAAGGDVSVRHHGSFFF